MKRARHIVVSVLAVATALSLFGTPALALPNGASAHDVTSPEEAKRVDSILTPKLNWGPCPDFIDEPAQVCAQVDLPVDYDKPEVTTRIVVGKIPAKDPSKRKGSLFLSDLGMASPGLVSIAQHAARFSPEILEQFDLVGMDRRGIEFSQHAYCRDKKSTKARELTGYFRTFMSPTSAHEWDTGIMGAREFAEGCSKSVDPLIHSMSDAQLARDMEVLRRAVGDEKLTYWGYGVGAQVGLVYANLFPDRVRAITGDAMADPFAFVGQEGTTTPQSRRIGADLNIDRMVNQIFALCDQAGSDKCVLAKAGTKETVDRLRRELAIRPIQVGEDENPMTFGPVEVVDILLSMVKFPDRSIEALDMIHNAAVTAGVLPGNPTEKAQSRERLNKAAKTQTEKASAKFRNQPSQIRSLRARDEQGYDTIFDTYYAHVCTSARHPGRTRDIFQVSREMQKDAPYSSLTLMWDLLPCAEKDWTSRDRTAYLGPFDKKTVNPVLMVAPENTLEMSADVTAKGMARMPGAALVRTNAWSAGYLNSECTRAAVDSYLLGLKVPVGGTLMCMDGAQPTIG